MADKTINYLLEAFPETSQTFVINEMLELSRKGYRINIFSLYRPRSGVVHKKARKLVRRTIYCPHLLSPVVIMSNIRCFLSNPIRYLSCLPQAGRAIYLGLVPRSVFFAGLFRKRGISRIHVHFMSNPATSARIISKFLGLRYSLIAHREGIFHLPPRDARQRIMEADPFITISRFNKDYLRETYRIPEDRINVVHCGVDVNRFRPDGRIKKDISMLWVGRMVKHKRPQDLIRTCSMLKKRGIRFNCVFAGDGPEREKMERLASRLNLEDQVSFAGAMDNDMLAEHYSRSDIFVMTSSSEGIPVVVMEAMATGLPVVATDITGMREIMEDGKTGILVKVRDTMSLASSIGYLLDRPGIRKRFGMKGREKIVREFNLKRECSKVAGLICK